MRITSGTVIAGKIVPDALPLNDGRQMFIVAQDLDDADDDAPSVEALAELEAGIGEADRGEMIAGDALFALLRRYG